MKNRILSTDTDRGMMTLAVPVTSESKKSGRFYLGQILEVSIEPKDYKMLVDEGVISLAMRNVKGNWYVAAVKENCNISARNLIVPNSKFKTKNILDLTRENITEPARKPDFEVSYKAPVLSTPSVSIMLDESDEAFLRKAGLLTGLRADKAGKIETYSAPAKTWESLEGTMSFIMGHRVEAEFNDFRRTELIPKGATQWKK